MRETYKEKAIREAKENGGVLRTNIGVRNPCFVWVHWKGGGMRGYKTPSGMLARELITVLQDSVGQAA